MDRRRFLKGAGAGALGFPCLLQNAPAQEHPDLPLREASYYEQSPGAEYEIECTLCPRVCRVGDLERGYCGVRENRRGTYYTLVYGLPCSVRPDPIEKKPFYHVLPGSRSFSIATAGCNMHCKFCQNWEISQARPEQIRNVWLPPSQVAAAAKEASCETIAYTYTEPTVFIEYVLDAAREAREMGVRSVVVTAAYISQEPLREMCASVDAIKVDFKAIRDDFYRQYCDSTLAPVLDALVTIRRSGTWLELVYLVIPTLNDSDDQLRDASRWVREHLGTDVPVHFSRFHPAYRLTNLPPTPLKTVRKARDIALAEGLEFVYVGNVPPGTEGESTRCPMCGSLLIERSGYSVHVRGLPEGACSDCGHPIPGMWA